MNCAGLCWTLLYKFNTLTRGVCAVIQANTAGVIAGHSGVIVGLLRGRYGVIVGP